MTSVPAPTTESESPPKERRDPLAPVLALGRRQVRTGALIGLAGALIMHGAVAGEAASSMREFLSFVQDVRGVIKDRMHAEYDVDLHEPPPPPPPPPPPEPEPEPERSPQPKTNEAPPPPAPAEAANVLTQDPDPDAPVDFTGGGFVVGTAETYSGGITAGKGTSKSAVRDLRAVPTGTGQPPPGPVATAKPAVDLSQRANKAGDWGRLCPFPSEANVEGINYADVLISVSVGTDGRAKTASVIKDPGTGFGAAARSCALRGQYTPALNAAGQPVLQTLVLVVQFRR